MDLEPLRRRSRTPSLGERLVLAVDDDPDNLLLMVYTVESLGYSCMTATDGQTALSLAQTHSPNLILLDVILPALNGIEVVQVLRQQQRTAAIPVIAVTSLVNLEDREQILQAGYSDYISKPYILEEMEALIRRYLA